MHDRRCSGQMMDDTSAKSKGLIKLGTAAAIGGFLMMVFSPSGSVGPALGLLVFVGGIGIFVAGRIGQA